MDVVAPFSTFLAQFITDLRTEEGSKSFFSRLNPFSSSDKKDKKVKRKGSGSSSRSGKGKTKSKSKKPKEEIDDGPMHPRPTSTKAGTTRSTSRVAAG